MAEVETEPKIQDVAAASSTSVINGETSIVVEETAIDVDQQELNTVFFFNLRHYVQPWFERKIEYDEVINAVRVAFPEDHGLITNFKTTRKGFISLYYVYQYHFTTIRFRSRTRKAKSLTLNCTYADKIQEGPY